MSNYIAVLGAWMLTYALHSTLLLGGAWALLRVRRFDHGAREIVWKVALVGGIVTATLQSSTDWQPRGTIAIAQNRAVLSEPLAENVAPAPESTERAGESPDASSAASSAQGDAESLGAAKSNGIPVAVMTWAWLVLALPLVIVYAARRLVLTGRIGDRRPVNDPTLLALLDALRSSGEVSGPVQLTASQAISSPVALGGSEICLPATALTDLESEQMRAMLAHELAHLVRRDPFWLVLACVIERALFFQPLNRLARREMLLSAEYLADEWAARRAGGIPLAKALVKVAEWIQASPLGVPVAGFAEERSQLAVRVSRLLDRAEWAAPKSLWRVSMFAVAVVLSVAAFAPGISLANAPVSAPRVEIAKVLPESPADVPTSTSLPAGVAPQSSRSVVSEPRTQSSDSTLVPELIARLRDEDREVRRATADALGRMQDRRAIAPLVNALEDEDNDVRTAALHALSNFEQGVPAPPIRKLLDSDDAETRATALRMLGEMRDRVSIPTITQHVMDQNDEARAAALEALEEMDAPIAEDLVARVLEDQSEELRQLGLRVAADRQMVTLVPRVIALLQDHSGDVREQAAETLTEMKTEASHRALRAAITHRDPRVRRIAVSYLGDEADPL